MLKKLCSLLLALILCASVFVIPGNKAQAAPVSLSASSPAVAVDAGQKVSLSQYLLSGFPLSEFSLTPKDGAPAVGSSFRAKEPGLYRYDAVRGDLKTEVFFVVKNPDETDYVVYEKKGFQSDADLKGLTLASGEQGDLFVQDGKLHIKGDDTRVLLPADFAGLGNLNIDVTATIINPETSKKWVGIIFRALEDKDFSPYYQMTVRSKASGFRGVEAAIQTGEEKPEVLQRSAYTENIDPEKMYHMQVKLFENQMTEQINDAVLIYADDITLRKNGRVGFRTSKAEIVIESIKISLQTEAPEAVISTGSMVDVRPVKSNLVTTPSLVSYVNTKADFDSILQASPATAFFYLNEEGQVTDKEGAALATLPELFEKLDLKVIPAFLPASEKAVEKLAAYVTENEVKDVAVAAEDAALLKAAYDKNPLLRGIWLCPSSDYSAEGLHKIRQTANSNFVRVVVLPYEGLNDQVVAHLQGLLVTVWAAAPEKETEHTQMNQILTGVNGMVVENRKLAEHCFADRFAPNTITRHIWIIGHRGAPYMAPENSVEGTLLAYEMGADMAENDIYLTTDGEVVVIHNPTVDGVTNGTGSVEHMTYAQLQELTLNDPTGGQFPNCKIPKLADYLRELKKLDKRLFIEIKSGNPEIVDKMVALIKEYDVAEKVSVISFYADQIKRTRALMPELSIGLLCNGMADEAYIFGPLKDAVELVQKNGSTFNHAKTALTKELVTELNHRGITIWPWTYIGTSELFPQMLWGINGLTTDNPENVQKMPKKVVCKTEISDVKVGDTLTLDYSSVSYDGKETPLGDKAQIELIAPEGNVKLEGNRLTVLAEGTFSVYCRAQGPQGYGEDRFACSTLLTLSPTGKAAPDFKPLPDEKGYRETDADSETSAQEQESAENPYSGELPMSIILIVLFLFAGVAMILAARLIPAPKDEEQNA